MYTYDYIKSSDVIISPKVWASYQYLYNKRLRFSKEHLEKYAKIVEYSIGVLSNDLNFDSKVRVRFCRFKGNRGGEYNSQYNCIGMMVYRVIESTLNLLAHELVHAEQYHEGRLANGSGKFHWNNGPSDKVSVPYHANYNYNRYKNLPWEVEAFTRSPQLTKKHLKVVTEYAESLS